jgi:hypothetical protein
MAFTFAWLRILSFRDCRRAMLLIKTPSEGYYPTYAKKQGEL